MTEKKKFFFYLTFLWLNILDFSWVFFVKTAPLIKKVNPSFPAAPLSKLRSCQAPPLLENLVGASTPPTQQKGGCAHYASGPVNHQISINLPYNHS